MGCSRSAYRYQQNPGPASLDATEEPYFLPEILDFWTIICYLTRHHNPLTNWRWHMFFPEVHPVCFLVNTEFNHEKLNEGLPAPFRLELITEPPLDIHLRDTFDGALRLTGRLLVQHEQNLFLVDGPNETIFRQPCPSAWRFWPELADGPVKSHLTDVLNFRAFLDLKTLPMSTGQMVLLDDQGKTHVRADLHIFARNAPNRVIGQTRPLRGYETSHHLLIDHLQHQGAQLRTINADLYAFLGEDQPTYQSKPAIPMDPEGPAYDTLNRIISTFLTVARQNEDGIRADYDTEFAHDYRVSLRKIRSALSLFKGVLQPDVTRRLKQQLAEIMKETNGLRDLDVYLLDMNRFFAMVPESLHQGLIVLFQSFRQDRQKAWKKVARMLRSPSYAKTMLRIAEQLDNRELPPGSKAECPTLDLASELIWQRYRQVCKIARRIDRDTPDEKIHKLRIECKKLRYLMEFFSPLYMAKPLKQQLKSLKILQDNLGHFNDCAVQQRFMHHILQNIPQSRQSGLKLAAGIGALITVLHQSQLRERHLVETNFASFDSNDTRRAFQELFAPDSPS